jgi:hypothetical protein
VSSAGDMSICRNSGDTRSQASAESGNSAPTARTIARSSRIERKLAWPRLWRFGDARR